MRVDSTPLTSSIRLVLWAALAFPVMVGVASAANAADFFACDCQAGADPNCSAGSDAGLGTAASPWRTIERLRQTHRNAACGDNFYLCEGGSFANSGSDQWFDGSIKTLDCRTDAERAAEGEAPAGRQHIAVTSYAPQSWTPATPGVRPKILSGAGRTVFSMLNGSQDNSLQGWDLSNLIMTCTGCTSKSGAYGLRVAGNLSLGAAEDNEFGWYNIDNIEVSGFDIGAQTDVGLDRPYSKHLHITNSYFHNNRRHGVMMTGNEFLVDGNRFEYNGCAPESPDPCDRDHELYVLRAPQDRVGPITVSNNSFDNPPPDPDTGRCGYSVVASWSGHDVTIEGNYIHNPTGNYPIVTQGDDGQKKWCAAIAGSDNNGSASFAGCRNCVIRNNVIVNFAQGIWTEGFQGLIENNVFIYEPIEGVNQAVVIAGVNVYPSDGITIRNNTMFTASRGGSLAAKYPVGFLANYVGAKQLQILGNVAQFSGGVGQGIGLTPSQIAASDFNIIYNGAAFANNMSLAAWAAQNPTLDQNSIDADPQFESIATKQLWPASESSPLFGLGDAALFSSEATSTICNLSFDGWIGSCGAPAQRSGPPIVGAYGQTSTGLPAAPPPPLVAPILLE